MVLRKVFLTPGSPEAAAGECEPTLA